MSISLTKAAIGLLGGGVLMLLAVGWVSAGEWQSLCLAAGLVMLCAWAKTEHWFDAAMSLFFLGAFGLFSLLVALGPL